jgi:glucose uptake protein
MSEIFGFLFVLVSIALWGSYLVPQKTLGNVSPFLYQGLMAIGIVAANILTFSFLKYDFSFSIFGVVSGLAWSVGNIMFVKSIGMSGMSRAPPMSSGMIIILSMIVGIAIFAEPVKSVYMVAAAAALLVSGIYITAKSVASEKGPKNPLRGLMFAAMAGTAFGLYLTPMKFFDVEIGSFLFSMTIGIAVGCAAIFMMYRPKVRIKAVPNGISSGVMWSFANTAAVLAVSSIGFAISLPLTQIAMLVSIAWGLLYFREIKAKKNMTMIVIGSLILILGAFVLGFAKV